MVCSRGKVWHHFPVMKVTKKNGWPLAGISFALLVAGAFFLADVFWSWTHLENDCPLAMGCWIAGALLSLGCLVFRQGARVAHWIILSVYLLIVLAIVYFLMTWKMDRMF